MVDDGGHGNRVVVCTLVDTYLGELHVRRICGLTNATQGAYGRVTRGT